MIVPVGWHELVAELLCEPPFSGAHVGAPSLGSEPAPPGSEYVRGFYPASADAPDFRSGLRARMARLAHRIGVPELDGLELQFKALPREDYAQSWRKTWKPFRVGTLAVVDSRWQGQLGAATRRLVLEPGGAFGTGRHPTTRRCLEELQRLVRPGTRLVDAGSGSGILSVAAVLFGAERVVGFDIDPNAIPYSLELARDNGVEGACDFRAGGFDTVTGEAPFDGAFANIYSDVLQEQAGALARLLRPGGWCLASGCPAEKEPATREALVAAGLGLVERWQRGRWVTLELHRRG